MPICISWTPACISRIPDCNISLAADWKATAVCWYRALLPLTVFDFALSLVGLAAVPVFFFVFCFAISVHPEHYFARDLGCGDRSSYCCLLDLCDFFCVVEESVY